MLRKHTGLKTCYGNFENVFSRFKVDSNSPKAIFVNGSIFNMVSSSDKVSGQVLTPRGACFDASVATF